VKQLCTFFYILAKINIVTFQAWNVKYCYRLWEKKACFKKIEELVGRKFLIHFCFFHRPVAKL